MKVLSSFLKSNSVHKTCLNKATSEQYVRNEANNTHPTSDILHQKFPYNFSNNSTTPSLFKIKYPNLSLLMPSFS